MACKTRFEELEDDLEGASLALTKSARSKMGSQILHWQARMELLISAPEITSEVQERAQTSAERLKKALEILNGSQNRQRNRSLLCRSGQGQISVIVNLPDKR